MAGEIAEGTVGLEQWKEHGFWEQVPFTAFDLGLLNPLGLHAFI